MSIPARPSARLLPDFRNRGIWLRALLAANGLMLVVVLTGNRVPAQWPAQVVELAAVVEPALLLTLPLLYLLAPSLRRMPRGLAAACVVTIAMAATAGVDRLLASLFDGHAGWRAPLAAGGGAALLLYWFALRARAQAPALAEARLAALNARIRPHFLFNSLNAVLGMMRTDPRRAEAVLEELAELYRVVMRENRGLVPLAEEIEFARKYLDIERLRLGERLRVDWDVAACPPDAVAPPLMLQPLLENAVYHGIEPAARPGTIQVRITAPGNSVRIEIDNPWLGNDGDGHRRGSRLALDNLRERLMLFYDLEASLASEVADGRYRVRVDLPRRRIR